jgi:hypothetical protein
MKQTFQGLLAGAHIPHPSGTKSLELMSGRSVFLTFSAASTVFEVNGQVSHWTSLSLNTPFGSY